jgi:hypothetical protein
MSVSLSDGSGENVQAGLEAVLFGEVSQFCGLLTSSNRPYTTQSVHDKTCGAFEYFGKVRFRDGLIVLRRELVSDLIYRRISIIIPGHRRRTQTKAIVFVQLRAMVLGSSKDTYTPDRHLLDNGIQHLTQ